MADVPAAGGSGSDEPVPLRLRPRRAERRTSWVLLGVLLVCASGLAFAVWARGVGDRRPVLALARDLDAGETVTADALTEVRVGASGPVGVVASDQLDRIVGSTALTDLAAGTLVSESVVGPRPAIDPGTALVALPVPLEHLPVPDLPAGQPVLLVATVDPLVGVATGGDASTPPSPSVWAARVFDTETLVDSTGLDVVRVVLAVDLVDAPAIAAATADDGLRLVALEAGVESPIASSSQVASRPAPSGGAGAGAGTGPVEAGAQAEAEAEGEVATP